MKKIIFAFLILIIFSNICVAQYIVLDSTKTKESQIFSTTLFNITFQLTGQKDSSTLIHGTCFIMERPIKTQDTTIFGLYTLITARHVLDDIKSDKVRITLRRKIDEGNFVSYPYVFKIRDKGRNLYVTHPNDSIDVAAMDIALPNDNFLVQISTNFIITDSDCEKINLNSGYDLHSLGFPEGISANDAGFPILRTGKIASFPVYPSKYVKKIYLDSEILPGNSGGPVFLNYQNIYKSSEEVLISSSFNYIIGLLTDRVLVENQTTGERKPLRLGVVIPGQFILETINLLQTH